MFDVAIYFKLNQMFAADLNITRLTPRLAQFLLYFQWIIFHESTACPSIHSVQ